MRIALATALFFMVNMFPSGQSFQYINSVDKYHETDHETYLYGTAEYMERNNHLHFLLSQVQQRYTEQNVQIYLECGIHTRAEELMMRLVVIEPSSDSILRENLFQDISSVLDDTLSVDILYVEMLAQIPRPVRPRLRIVI